MAESVRAVGSGGGWSAGVPAQTWTGDPDVRSGGRAGSEAAHSDRGKRDAAVGGTVSDRLVSLTFHEGSGRWMAVYRDRRTGEVLKVVPPEELLDAVARVRQGVGLYLDAYG